MSFQKFQNKQAVKAATKKKKKKKGFVLGQGKEPANLSPKDDQIDAIKRAIAARSKKK